MRSRMTVARMPCLRTKQGIYMVTVMILEYQISGKI